MINHLLGIVILIAVTPVCLADKGDIDMGVGYGIGYFEFSEPEFTSAAEPVGVLLASGSWYVSNIDRMDLSWRHINDVIGGGSNAKPNTYGISIKGDQIILEWLHKFRISRYFKPWIGAGFVFNQYSSTDKFHTDEEGYAISIYEDREELTYSLTTSISLDYQVNQLIISPKLSYDIALEEGPSGASFGLTAKYQLNFK